MSIYDKYGDGTFNSIIDTFFIHFINDMKYWYQTVWVYNLLLGVSSIVLPSLLVPLFATIVCVVEIYHTHHYIYYNKILKRLILVLLFPCVVSTSVMIAVYGIVYCLLMSHIMSLTWIVQFVNVCVEKKIWLCGKLGFLFWRFILAQFLNSRDSYRKNVINTRLGVIAINYSFCRYHGQSKKDNININDIKYAIVNSEHSDHTQLFEYLNFCIMNNKEKNVRSFETKQESAPINLPRNCNNNYNDNCKGNEISGFNYIAIVNDQDNDNDDGISITIDPKQKMVDQLIKNPLKDVTYSTLRNVKLSPEDKNFDDAPTFWKSVFSNVFGKDEHLPGLLSIIVLLCCIVYFVSRIYFIIFPFIFTNITICFKICWLSSILTLLNNN